MIEIAEEVNRFDVMLVGGLDWIFFATFFTIALFYFLAPLVGYTGSNRRPFLASLYLILTSLAITVFQSFIPLLIFRDADNGKAVYLIIAIFRGVTYLLALAIFIKGLRNLKQ